MIKVYFSPQVSDRKIEYGFNGETLTVKIGDTEDVFDLSSLPDGELNKEDDESIETTLPVCPVISAKRINGILHLELLNWIGKDAPYESRFPEWVELPLSKDIETKETIPFNIPCNIPWRSKEEIDAERKAIELAEMESKERRARIIEGLNTAVTEVELRDVMKDMAIEMGLIN